MRRTLPLFPLFLLLAACAPTRETGTNPGTPPGPDRPEIAFGWSFGECWGECQGELIVSSDGAVSYETSGWENEVYLWVTGTAHDATLDALEAAYDATDRDGLESVYGCPDCADGGREYLRFLDDLDPAGSDWEWGGPPIALEDLWDVLRPLADAMRACNDGEGYDQDRCDAAFVDGDGEDTDPDPSPPPPG